MLGGTTVIRGQLCCSNADLSFSMNEVKCFLSLFQVHIVSLDSPLEMPHFNLWAVCICTISSGVWRNSLEMGQCPVHKDPMTFSDDFNTHATPNDICHCSDNCTLSTCSINSVEYTSTFFLVNNDGQMGIK